MNPAQWLPAGLSVDDIVTAVAALGAFMSLLAVWQAVFVPDQLGPRLKALSRRRDELRGAMLASAQRRPRAARQLGMMQRTLQRLNLLRSKGTAAITLRLAQGGLRSRDALILYLFCQLCLPFAFGGGALLGLYVLKLFDLHDPMRMFVSLGMVGLGFYAPNIYLKNAITKRRKALQMGLPDGLDLLVICVEAGLSLDAALTRVARELGKSAPELADEFSLTAIELAFLPNRVQALANLNLRTEMPAIRGVVNTLQQTERYGTPLAQSLRVLAAEYRDQRLMKAEEKAARLPAILTVPMIVFILPTLFIVLIGPAILRTIDAFRQM